MVRSHLITSKIMSSIHSKDTKPEMFLRRELWKNGLRYRVNCKKILGKPDIVFLKKKIAIFCDGDFWHGHNWVLRGQISLEAELSTYSEYWSNKIRKKIERDNFVTEILIKNGWVVIRFWESEILKDLNGCVEIIMKEINVKKSVN